MTFGECDFCATPRQELFPAYPPFQHDLSPRINSMQLKHVLCEVDSWSSTSWVRDFRSGDFAAFT